MEKDIIICDCNSTEHQMVILYSEDENQGIKYPMCYVHIHLTKKPFLKRLKYAIQYLLGRQCNYGAFDEFIFNPEDSEKLQKLVNYLKETEKWNEPSLEHYQDYLEMLKDQTECLRVYVPDYPSSSKVDSNINLYFKDYI